MAKAKSDDQFASVAVPVPGLGELDYRVPSEMLVARGDRVVVQVGGRRMLGMVVALASASDYTAARMKSILMVVKDTAPMPPDWLKLCDFAARYYHRTFAEAALPALPPFLRRIPGKRHAQWIEKARAASFTRDADPLPAPQPNAEQTAAVEAVCSAEGFAPFVLFGVTGSGKTEVYLRLIERVLAVSGKNQVLLLVPEINLTPQLEARVRGRFPREGVAVLHSELADGERSAAWLAVHEGRARILVGTRMAVFASFVHLSLVIVDEEHDASFKAGDGLRYSGRDLAVWRASSAKCPVVLGSATPSLETWAKVERGDYKLLELKHRAVESAELPKIDLIAPMPRGERGTITGMAAERMREMLESGRQVLVFMNRRGYAPVLSCPSCGWVSSCVRCSAFTVFHKAARLLVCHHCGWSRPVPEACPGCGNVDILPRGSGTERIEEELERLFPGKSVLRVDRDSVSRKGEAEAAFARVHSGEVDILVGTQMIAKGHDFRNVGLVLVLNVDAQILSPAVRARERLFATLMQVAGRAGRSGARGSVLIQTRFPQDPLFEALARQDYRLFAARTLEERRENFCVPYVHQALLTAEATTLAEATAFLEREGRRGDGLAGEGVRVYDAVPMPLVRLMNVERAQLLVEADERATLHRFLSRWLAGMPRTTTVRWSLEIDPLEA